MKGDMLKSFIDRFNAEKEGLQRKFEDINRKLESIDRKFNIFDERMGVIENKCRGIEKLYDRLKDFSLDMGEVQIYLSQIETRLNEYKTLKMSGSKLHNGELYILKVKLQKVKPIINWENNELLSSKYKQIENKFEELEENQDRIVV